MFNPQLDALEFRKIQKGTVNTYPNFSGITWTDTHIIDLKEEDLFRAFEPDGTPVEHEDGTTHFIAKSNGYVNELGIPAIEIKQEK